MGEVYRARDTRLDQSVEIKVLPDEFSAKEAIRARFEREAKTISSLTHPNICTLHDVGREGGTEFIVMELLEGENLADRTAKGPLPMDEAIRFAIQIADALARAHKSGVVHRDLKPGNVMITSSGAKLLDFGLAKASAVGGGPVEGLTNLPTEQKNLTEEGTILGTFQYMAPEQLEGQEADARTDIFAFGALLYEMVTGHRAFIGKSRVSLIAAIMEHEPQSITAHQPLSPPALDRLIRQCLKKNPDERWQTAHDLSLQLRWIEEGGSQAGIPAPVVARRKLRERTSWIVAAALGIVAVVFASLWYRAVTAPKPILRTTILPASSEGYHPGNGIVLSPDGSRLVFVHDSDGSPHLWIRELANAESQPLRGTDGADYPFWSPDGNDIGFFADGKLKRISVSGGGARSLADVSQPRGGTWSEGGWIVYAPESGGSLMKIPESGGQAVAITNLKGDSEFTSHRWPWALPGGETLLYLAQAAEGGTPNDASVIRALDLKSGKAKDLVGANSSVQYSPSGHILYWSQGSVLAQRFDPKSFEISSAVTPVADDVMYTANEYAAFSQAANGSLLFQTGTAMGGLSELAWVGIDGTRQETIRGADQYYNVSLSPDDRRLAVEQGNQDLWVIDIERGTSSRFTFGGTNEVSPVWSPDGAWIYYGSSDQSKRSIRRKRSSGVGEEEPVLERSATAVPTSISNDGRKLLFHEQSGSDWHVMMLDLETKEVTPVVATPFVNVFAEFGPTSDWLTYLSNESGRFEVYVLLFSGDGGRWQISTEGGATPRWSSDGKTIFFLRSGTVWRVDVTTGESFKAGIPAKLFDIPYRGGPIRPFDVAGDAKRFVFITAEQTGDTRAPMTLVQNWTRLLEH